MPKAPGGCRISPPACPRACWGQARATPRARSVRGARRKDPATRGCRLAGDRARSAAPSGLSGCRPTLPAPASSAERDSGRCAGMDAGRSRSTRSCSTRHAPRPAPAAAIPMCSTASDPRQIAEMAELQAALLERASGLARAGWSAGLCGLLARTEEGEEQAAQIGCRSTRLLASELPTGLAPARPKAGCAPIRRCWRMPVAAGRLFRGALDGLTLYPLARAAKLLRSFSVWAGLPRGNRGCAGLRRPSIPGDSPRPDTIRPGLRWWSRPAGLGARLIPAHDGGLASVRRCASSSGNIAERYCVPTSLPWRLSWWDRGWP
jgi:hypothetical protein